MSEPIFTKQHGGTFAKRCKHFDGINFMDESKTCKAGVVMKDITVEQPYKYRYEGEGPRATVYTSNHSLPCFKDTDPCGVCKCDKQEFRTQQEIDDDRAAMRAICQNVDKARAAIVDATEGKRGVGGSISCPVCESGELRYSVASLNGHIHAACSTESCVRWME